MGKSEHSRHQKQLIFEYPALPKWETATYFTIMISILIYAWYLVRQVTLRGDMQDPRYEQWIKKESNWLLGEDTYKDVTDTEWPEWKRIVWTQFPWQCIHWSMFNWLSMASKCSLLSMQFKDISLLLVSFGGVFFTYGEIAFASTLINGLLLFSIAYFSRSKLLIWACSAPVLLFTADFAIKYTDKPFYTLILTFYNLCKYISYTSEMIDGNVRPQDSTYGQKLYRMLQYAFFPPYLISLIVTYDDWERQLKERQIRPRNYPRIFFTIARIIFWYFVCENMLHFFHMNAIIRHPGIISKCDLGTLAALGYAIGQYFHIKYIVVFGLPSMFAYCDNMQPYDPPICIARVSLYSKVWRTFDRGLYAFFKRYIFVPICQPTFSLPRKIFAMLLVFGFVLMWHGFAHHNNVWIALNIFELFIEHSSKWIYISTGLRQWRERNMSDLMFRRILAWLQVFPYTVALISIFYFLGGSVAGGMYVDRIIIGELLHLRYPAFVLIAIGYVYCNCCMDCERWESERDRKKLKRN